MTSHSTPALPLKERLVGIALFLPKFEDPDFIFGKWSESREIKPGVMTMPYFCFSAEADDFVHAAYALGWVRTDFSWPEWAQTTEAEELRDNPRCMARTTPDQLSRLLTVVIRQERFCEGALESAYASGLLTAICRRAAHLESETDDGGA